MSPARAITAAMRAQRKRDMDALYLNAGAVERYAVYAWWHWGWAMNGRGGLGYPGAEFGQRTQVRWKPYHVKYGATP